jgi:TPR repeat protein
MALDCFAQILRFAIGANSDLEKAPEAAHVQATRHYGDLFEEGRGVPQDIPNAIWRFRSASGCVFDRTPH